MKKILIAVIILTAAIFTAFALKGPLNIETIAIGTKAPLLDYELQVPGDGHGHAHTIKDLAGQNGIMVIFSCNTCPFVLAWEDRYNELHMMARDNKIGLVLVNSNEAKRDKDDSPQEMIKHARLNNYSMEYLIDKDHKLADAYGAKTTPHVFLFNRDFNLVYEGAIDDNYKDNSAVTMPYAINALANLGAGQKIDPQTSPAKGCSIKRVKP
ncbi:MAG: redoxin domain-containing protein [Luteibaculum sp.]